MTPPVAPPAAGRRLPPVSPVLALVVVAVLALLLRPAATSVGPVLPELSEALGGGGVAAGLLTALPPLAFGVMGLLAVPVARRLGLSGALLASAAIAVAGLLLRPWVGSMPVFLALSTLALVGGALGNVLLPAWIKRHSTGVLQRRLTSVYVAVLSVGGAAGAFLAVPLAQLPGSSWRTSLAAWGVLAAVPMLLWFVVWRRAGHDFPAQATTTGRPVPIWRSPTAVALTGMFALQSLNAYTQFGWLPRIYTGADVGAGLAGFYTGIIATCGILGGWVMPQVIARLDDARPLAVAWGVLTTIGYLGLLWRPAELGLLWALVLGVGGFAFPMVLALLPARTRHPVVTARLSGIVQPIGYFGAAVGPLTAGALVSATGRTDVLLGLLAASGVGLALTGWRAAAPTTVDDELDDPALTSPGEAG
ncbi:MFS transporter, CP family, cyanate transporter [Kytococcus aerolatus]|uniref:MFS transporter, CP family, cyanate transporter n=1 Tax=Kytococcus aerolatus TaxID=592308 RepID=A0A212T1X8_9MICO|nr:MFS transporter [Kytococcus aerolatus]SNC60058.1 MFS transporter, CP family, cyanate transporter [Kytococcus aerolatus]